MFVSVVYRYNMGVFVGVVYRYNMGVFVGVVYRYNMGVFVGVLFQSVVCIWWRNQPVLRLHNVALKFPVKMAV